MTVWQWNRVVNAAGLVVVGLALGLLAVLWVRAYVDDSADPHGYVLIFSVLGAVMLLLPLTLLGGGALLLRRGQRSGLGFQIAAGVIVALYGVLIPAAVPRIAGICVGAALLTVGVLGLRSPADRSRNSA